MKGTVNLSPACILCGHREKSLLLLQRNLQPSGKRLVMSNATFIRSTLTADIINGETRRPPAPMHGKDGFRRLDADWCTHTSKLTFPPLMSFRPCIWGLINHCKRKRRISRFLGKTAMIFFLTHKHWGGKDSTLIPRPMIKSFFLQYFFVFYPLGQRPNMGLQFPFHSNGSYFGAIHTWTQQHGL